jgi:methyl-accepting chemotaxis protein
MHYPRRVKVVDGRLQYGVIAVFLTVIVAGLLLFSALAVLLSFLFGGTGDGRAFVTGVLPFLLLNDLCIMILIIVVGVLATHRIAGPVYRIEEDIRRVLAGETGVVVRFRRGDAFPRLAEKVNELIERVERQRDG